MDEPLDILCLNCQEMINNSKVAAHSFLCIRPVCDLQVLEKNSPIGQLQYRLEKIINALEGISNQKNIAEAFEYKYLLKKAKELHSVNENTVEAVESTYAVAASVKKFSKAMIKPGLIIYSERLKELSSEKTALIIESLASNGCSKEILKLLNRKVSEISKMHSGFTDSANKRKALKNLSDNIENIDEIASQISRVITQRSSTNSVISPEGDEADEFDIEDIDQMYQLKEKEQSEKTIEDLHKYFYTKCLMVKLSYNSRHPSQLIQINELYKKVKALDVPMEKWDEFIKNEFSHPERWVRNIQS